MAALTEHSTDETTTATPLEYLRTENDNYHGLTIQCALVYLSIQCVLFAQLLSIVGTGAYARYIGEAVNGTSQDIWIPQGLVIAVTCTAPLIAQASDYWGRKHFIIVGAALCSIGCILLARANNSGMAIVGAVLQGVGSGTTSLLYAVSSEILPRRFRSMAQGGVNITNSLCGIFTLLVGFGFIRNSNDGWRIIWYFGTGFYAFGGVVIIFLYRPPKRLLEVSLTHTQKLKALDWVGYFFFSAGIIFFSTALTWSNNPYPWGNVHILATFIVGVVLLFCLMGWEYKKKTGFFHRDLFKKDRNFAIALVLIFIEGFTFYAVNNFLGYEYSVLLNNGVLRTGLIVCLVFFGGIVSSFLGGVYASRTKRLRPPLVTGMIFFIIYFGCMASLKLSRPSAIWGYTIFAGLGFGFGIVLAITAAQLSAPPELIAIASGLVLSMRALGGSVALPVYSAILNSQLTHLGSEIASRVLPLGLSKNVLPAFITALTTNDAKGLSMIPGATTDIIAAGVYGLKTTYRLGFRNIWITGAAVSVIGLVLALLVIDPRTSFNMHVDAPIDSSVEPNHVGHTKNDSVKLVQPSRGVNITEPTA